MAPTNSISDEDLRICRDVHAGLISSERQNINYLFLDPVDPNYFPTYLTIVKRPMDLGTLGENLEKGNVYASKDEFYSDAQLIFDNAVAFNRGRPESQFVVGLARKMTKALEREKKKAERRAMAAAGLGGEEVPKEGDKASSERLTKPEKKKKIKLKLKRSSSYGEMSPRDALTSNDILATEPTVSNSNTYSAECANEQKLCKKMKSKESKIPRARDIPIKAKPTQPKLKLKLSLSKKAVKEVKDAKGDKLLKKPELKDSREIGSTKDEKHFKDSKDSKEGKTDKFGKLGKEGKKKKARESRREVEPGHNSATPSRQLVLEGAKENGAPSSKPSNYTSPALKKSETAQGKKLKLKISRGKELPKGVMTDVITSSSVSTSKSKKQKLQSPTSSSNSPRIVPNVSKYDGSTPNSSCTGSSPKHHISPVIVASLSSDNNSKNSSSKSKDPYSRSLSSSSLKIKDLSNKALISTSSKMKDFTTKEKPSTSTSSSKARDTTGKEKSSSSPSCKTKDYSEYVSSSSHKVKESPGKSSTPSTFKTKDSSGKLVQQPASGSKDLLPKSSLQSLSKTKDNADKTMLSSFTKAKDICSKVLSSSSVKAKENSVRSQSSNQQFATSIKPSPSSLATAAAPLNATQSTTAATEIFDGVPLTTMRRAQCYKVMSSLKRRQSSNCRWFLKPVSDPRLIKDYREKIQTPMDLGTISTKLDKDLYPTVAHFVLDLRRVFANCLQYNTALGDSFRPVAMECLATVEDLMNFFIAKPEAPAVLYPDLLYCWEDCIKAINSLLEITNPDDGHQTAHYFLHPVSFFCGGSFPQGYLDKVKRPIDLGTIVQNLITGGYNSVGAFVADCRTVIENCRSYYANRDDGDAFLEKASRLNESMEQHLGKLFMFDRSEEGAAAREKAKSKCMAIKKPEKDFLKEIMSELRSSTYTDRFTKLSESATLPFEKPVDSSVFTDYPTFVDTPMDLETVDHKIDNGSYATPEDFEYDISLIFRNCEKYNAPKNNMHMIALGKHTAKTFRKLFSAKMRALERGGNITKPPQLPLSSSNKELGAVANNNMGGKKRPISPVLDDRQGKRANTEASKSSAKGPSRMVPKLTSNSSLGKAGLKPKGLKASGGKKLSGSPSKPTPADLDVPVPMHVAIAQIKESYPGRRQNKDLEDWEEDCLRFLRQLMRHPWISAERPKYIFHVPVHIIFPEIRDSYATKIQHPMDLTTAEAKLLQGAYQNSEEFVSDIALVFSNAITFNQAGHDIGEPMSCAYYEASTHLLKYARWLSLEVLQSRLSDCSDSPIVERGCAAHWKLTNRNRELARREMETAVFNENLEKTEPGEKLSWSEQECEKLLKALRHMTDSKHMSFFIQMNFPPDYTAFISKPIAWEKCQEKLRQRKYNTIGEVVADLRLIFTNALKYNERARNISSVSKLAYDSAIHMSRKLEAAIDRMLLSVSDRIGREKIDTITSHREMEAQARAEEEQMKLLWERDHPSSTVEVKTKLRVVQQRSSHRKQVTDFEFPFYDEEVDQREESHVDSVRHAKMLFEKQQKAHAAMKSLSLTIGVGVFERLEQRFAARAWAYRMAFRVHMERKRAEEKLNAFKRSICDGCNPTRDGTCISSILNEVNREQIKIPLRRMKKSKRKKLTYL